MRFTKAKEIKPLAPIAKPSNKLKKYLYGFVTLLTIILLATSTYGIYEFNYNYALQAPVTFRSPIVSRHRDILISPVGTQSASMILDLGKIADKIYTLESSHGKHDSCNNLGLFNGFGFRQNTSEWMCYSSHEEVRQLVINWLTTHIKDFGIEKALCMYNQGKVESSCTYSENYLSLK